MGRAGVEVSGPGRARNGVLAAAARAGRSPFAGGLVAAIATYVGLHWPYISGDSYYVFRDAGLDSLNGYVPILASLDRGFRFWMPEWGLGTNALAVVQGFGTNVFFFVPWLVVGAEGVVGALPFILLVEVVVTYACTYLWLRALRYGRLAASIAGFLAALSGFFLLWSQHYAFSSAPALLAMALLSVEWLLHRGRALPLVLVTAASAAYSPVLGYQVLLAVSVITAARVLLGIREEPFAKRLRRLAGVGSWMLLGVALSAVVLLPALWPVVDSPRIAGPTAFRALLGRVNDARFLATTWARLVASDLPVTLGIGPSQWYRYYDFPVVYFGSSFAIGLPFVIASQRGRRLVLAALAATTVIVLFLSPSAASIWSGFSARYYRWTFTLVPLQAVVVAAALDRWLVRAVSRREAALVAVWGILFLGGSWAALAGVLEVSPGQLASLGRSHGWVIASVLGVSLAVALAAHGRQLAARVLIAGGALLDVSMGSAGLLANREVEHVNPLGPGGIYDDATKDAAAELTRRFGTDARIVKTYLSGGNNDGVVQGYRTAAAFLSFHERSFLELLTLYDSIPRRGGNTNIRGVPWTEVALAGALGVRFLLSQHPVDQEGLSHLGRIAGLYVYELQTWAPLVVVHDRYFTASEVLRMHPEMRVDAMFKGVIVDDEAIASGLPKASLPGAIAADCVGELHHGLAHQATPIAPPSSDGFEYVVSGDDPHVSYRVRGADGPRRLSFLLEAQRPSVGDVFIDDGHGFRESHKARVAISPGTRRHTIPLLPPVRRLRIDLGTRGERVKVSELCIRGPPRTRIPAAGALQAQPFSATWTSDSKLTVELSREHAGIAVLQVAHSPGWSAKVNGAAAEVHRVQGGLVGVSVAPGSTRIDLSFVPPGLVAGSIVSSAGVVSLLAAMLARRSRERPGRTGQTDAPLAS